MVADLDHRHRDTLEKFFSHPSSANIEWRQVLSLLEAVGATRKEHNGKLKVTLGTEPSLRTTSWQGHRSTDDRRLAADARERGVRA